MIYVKKVLKNTFFQIGISVVALLLVAYFGYHVWHRVTSEVNTEVAVSLSVEETVSVTGYIFRDELPMVSYSSLGSLVASVPDGTKVPKDGLVGSVYESYHPEVVQRLTEIEEKIQLLSDSLVGSLSLKDASKIDQSIQELLTQLRSEILAQDFEAVSTIRKNITLLMNKRELVLGNVKNVEEAIDRLQAEAKQLTARLGARLESVKAPASGYYFAETDGYEKIFLPSLVSKLDVASFRELVSSSPQTDSRLSTGKMVLDFKWYYVCEVPFEEASGLEAGKSYPVEFSYNNDLRLDMKLERAEENVERTAVLLVFSTEQMPDGFVYDRQQPANVVKRTYTGFQIPSNAIRILEGVRGVYILDGSVVRFRAIEVIAIVDDVYVVMQDVENGEAPYPYLKRNDVIIISGKGLYDGRILS